MLWSSDLYNNGTTMEDNTKNSVIEMIENLYILQNHMADYNVTLTDDETAKNRRGSSPVYGRQ